MREGTELFRHRFLWFISHWSEYIKKSDISNWCACCILPQEVRCIGKGEQSAMQQTPSVIKLTAASILALAAPSLYLLYFIPDERGFRTTSTLLKRTPKVCHGPVLAPQPLLSAYLFVLPP